MTVSAASVTFEMDSEDLSIGGGAPLFPCINMVGIQLKFYLVHSMICFQLLDMFRIPLVFSFKIH